MSETPEQRAQRLGLISAAESPQQRASRLGLTPAHSKLTPRELRGNADHAVTAAEVDEAEQPTYAQQALGGIAALARDIPGAEAAQAGIRALVRRPSFATPVTRQDYDDALSDIRGAEDAAPSGVRNFNRLVGGSVAALATPGTAAQQGFLYGASKGILQANPVGIEERAKDAAIEGTVGAVTGKATELLSNAARIARAKPLGEQELAHTARIKAIDQVNYGAAKAEGAAASARPTIAHAGPAPASPQAVTDALNADDIKPFADMVRQSRKFAGADDATVARETFKLMSKQQGGLMRRLNEQGFDAELQLKHDNIAAAKDELMAAAEQIMPSFRNAVGTHATMAGERDAMRYGADAARRIVNNSSVAGKRLATQSPEAVKAALADMTAPKAQAATEGMLGRAKEMVGVRAEAPIRSALRSVAAPWRLSPYIRGLDSQTGKIGPGVLRSLLLSAGTPNP